MVNPFLMMIPTEKKSFKLPGKKKKLNRKEVMEEVRAGLSALRFEKKILSEMVWNLFFINCHPLVPGFLLLFLGSIFFAVAGYFTGAFEYTSSLIIIIQSLAIILFYVGIMLVKPYSSGYFSGLLGVRVAVRQRYMAGWIPVLKYILLISITAVIAGTLIIFALLLPGMSLGRVMGIEDVDIKVVMFLLIFASQIILVRFLQGGYSKKLVTGFMSYKIEVFKKGFLESLNNIPETPEGLTEEEISKYCEIMETIETASVKIRFLKTDHHHFFGYFPVCMIIPDIALILEITEKYKKYRIQKN
jgi:hypothetical protein